ncbi:hypothetical protein CDV55_107442 [Aspergillus turcosus]|nr:hypothetical protein CDV55_107442 [Aspergillus turcosus]
MTSTTAGLSVGAQCPKALLQKAPGRSYNDEMYYPANAPQAIAAARPYAVTDQTTRHARTSSTTSPSLLISYPPSSATLWGTMTPGVQAGIAASVAVGATILIGLIACLLHRMKRALHNPSQREEFLPETGEANPDANLYAGSTSTLAKVIENLKASSKKKRPFINAGSSSIYSNDQAQSNPFTSYRDQLWQKQAHHDAARARLASSSPPVKFGSLRSKKVSIYKSSHCSHGYVLTQEFQHVPPPQPTRLEKIVTTLCAPGSPRVRTAAAKSKPQTPPLEKETTSSTWSSMSSRNPYREDYDAYRFQPPSDISDDLYMVKVWWSAFPGVAAMSNPSVEELAGRILREGDRH